MPCCGDGKECSGGEGGVGSQGFSAEARALLLREKEHAPQSQRWQWSFAGDVAPRAGTRLSASRSSCWMHAATAWRRATASQKPHALQGHWVRWVCAALAEHQSRHAGSASLAQESDLSLL